jgi:hypothetical protein
MMQVGINLSVSGLLLAATQGLGIRWVVPKIGERKASIYAEILATVDIPFDIFLIFSGLYRSSGKCAFHMDVVPYDAINDA